MDSDKIADEMLFLRSTVLGWLTDSPLSLLECGAIFGFVNQQFFPIEWEIRGAILGEYDDEKRVPLARDFIRKANSRLDSEGFEGEKSSRELALLVERGHSTVFEIGSDPGFFRIFLGIRQLGEKLLCQVERIHLERDVTVSGG